MIAANQNQVFRRALRVAARPTLYAMICGLLLAAIVAIPRVAAQAQDWEPSIQKFEADDQANPPRLGAIVFTGASSIRRWETLAQEMAPLDVINRGFGGSQYSDLNQYIGRIVTPYRPRAVVVYEGDNDLAAGSPKTPASVAADAKQFVETVRAALPDTWIYVMSIKPSKLRWNEWPKMKAANKLIREYAGAQPRVQYIDVASAMFDASGNLPADLFVEDGLHPTAKCYALWTSIIKPVLLGRFGPPKIVGEIFFPYGAIPSAAYVFESVPSLRSVHAMRTHTATDNPGSLAGSYAAD